MATIRDELISLRTELSTKIDQFIVASSAHDMAIAEKLGAADARMTGLESRVDKVEANGFWTPKTLGAIAAVAGAVAALVAAAENGIHIFR